MLSCQMSNRKMSVRILICKSVYVFVVNKEAKPHCLSLFSNCYVTAVHSLSTEDRKGHNKPLREGI